MTSTHFWLIELGRQSSIWHISFYCISKGYYELKISSKEKARTRNLQVNDTALFMPLSPLPCNVTHYKNMHCQKVLGYIQYGIKLWKTKLFHCTWCCKMWGSHNSCTENSSPLVHGVSMDHNTPIKTHHHIPEDTHLQHSFPWTTDRYSDDKEIPFCYWMSVFITMFTSLPMGLILTHLNATYSCPISLRCTYIQPFQNYYFPLSWSYLPCGFFFFL